MSKSIKLPQRHKEVLAVIFYTFECLLNQNLTNQYFLILSNHTDVRYRYRLVNPTGGSRKLLELRIFIGWV